MTEADIITQLHRMADESGDKHQEFLAGLNAPQRHVVSEALAALERAQMRYADALAGEPSPLRDIEAAQAALRERNLLLREIATRDPLIMDPAGSGQHVCFYGCGYGTLEGVDKEEMRNVHRRGCPWVRARQPRRWQHWLGQHWLEEEANRLRQEP